MKKALRDLDIWLDGKLPLVILLALVVILRLPGFFEPYWYGDEGIYLTVGQSINAGKTLYSQIVDHKTPIIYYLARVPGQFEFRLLLLGWMLTTTTAFFFIAKKILKHFWGVMIASVLFVLLTTLPWLEGHIPNGELFVMGFVLVGGWILSKTELWQTTFEEISQPKKPLPIAHLPQLIHASAKALPNLDWTNRWPISAREAWLLLTAGVLFGLGILTKVPGLFDVLSWFVLGWILLIRTMPSSVTTPKKFAIQLVTILQHLFILGIGVLIPIFLSALYFVMLGAGSQYLEFGLLYNFHYAGNWGLPFSHPLLVGLFTLQGKLAVTAIVALIISYWRNKYSAKFQFVSIWMLLALFGSLLSNRPYPHYFQQIVPPLALLIGMLTNWLVLSVRNKEIPQRYLLPMFTNLMILLMTGAAFLLIGFRPYETIKYYTNWGKLITHQTTQATYRNQFNHLMADNYQAAQFLQEHSVKNLFIWGTNPMLYALSKTVPVGRFTVSFHITDIDAYEETMQALEQSPPPYIVVMNDERAEFPEFYKFLYQNYLPGTEYQYFSLWKYVGNQPV